MTATSVLFLAVAACLVGFSHQQFSFSSPWFSVGEGYNQGYGGYPGYNQGYNGGYNQGYNGGYNQGYNQPGYNQGYNGGYNQGYNGGYNGGGYLG